MNSTLWSEKFKCSTPSIAKSCTGPANVNALKSAFLRWQNPSHDALSLACKISPGTFKPLLRTWLKMVPSRSIAALHRGSRAQTSNDALPPSEWPRYATWLKSNAPSAGEFLTSVDTTNDASSTQTPTTRLAVAYQASMLVSAM